MSEGKIFNRRINRFLKEDSLSNASALIMKINVNYEMDKVVGYYPCPKYKSNNKIGESPREEYLTEKYFIPLSYKAGHELLAKKLVYRLMAVDDLEAKLRDL